MKDYKLGDEITIFGMKLIITEISVSGDEVSCKFKRYSDPQFSNTINHHLSNIQYGKETTPGPKGHLARKIK
jgi:hypothetical protein